MEVSHNIQTAQNSPKSLGYHFPAEWEKHEATWLTFPWCDDSFPGKMNAILPSYMHFVKTISLGEKVRINVNDLTIKTKVEELIQKYAIDPTQIELFFHSSDDVWCRDHGPSFVINNHLAERKAIVDWGFNAWGGKYPSENDNNIPSQIAESFKLPMFKPGIFMEGGSVDFNGKGTVLTTEACLLNENRNPHLSKKQIEQYLVDYYGVENILWLNDGIEGDDTDGHVDDITRFVNEDTVVTAIETSMSDANYMPLKINRHKLSKMHLENGKQLNVVELPMPHKVIHNGRRLPASYANFYICNHAVIVPMFGCKADNKAVDIISTLFPDRKVVGIDSVDIVWGFGSFHCLSQQEPV